MVLFFNTAHEEFILEFYKGFTAFRMFFIIGVLKNFTKKSLCWSLFLIKLQTFQPAIFWKRDSNKGIFSFEVNEFFKNT